MRRRDFTANAMALSLNEGSWGLLLDPLNGTADISTRHLRLVSNYGFLEDPIRLVRAIRLISRTGWEMEERTKARYDNAKAEGVISAITAVQRGYELEEIGYEEEPLQVLKALESEGWMEHLSPAWTGRSADVQGLERLHDRFVQLLMAGLHPDPSAAQFRLLTAKLSSSQLSSLKKTFVRSDLIAESNALDAEAKHVLQKMTAKDAAKPSQLWKLLHSVKPEAVLWLFFTNKTAAVQNKFENFFTKWPEARQKIPNAILQDMRIVPEVEGYDELLDKLTFAFMDGELPTEETIRKFAEPYSPPAPPPPVIVRRSRTVKRVTEPKGSKAKGRKAAKKAVVTEAGDLSLAAAGDAAARVVATSEKAGTAAGVAKTVTGKAVPVKAATEKAPAAKAAGKTTAQPTKSVAQAGAKKSEKSAKVAQAVKTPTKPLVKGKIEKKKATGKVAAKTSSKASSKPAPVKGKAQKAAVVAKVHGKAGKAAHGSSRTAAKKPVKPSASARGKAKASAKTAHQPIAKKASVKSKASGKTAAKKAGASVAKKKTGAKPASRPASKPKAASAKSATKSKPKPKKKSGK